MGLLYGKGLKANQDFVENGVFRCSSRLINAINFFVYSLFKSASLHRKTFLQVIGVPFFGIWLPPFYEEAYEQCSYNMKNNIPLALRVTGGITLM